MCRLAGVRPRSCNILIHTWSITAQVHNFFFFYKKKKDWSKKRIDIRRSFAFRLRSAVFRICNGHESARTRRTPRRENVMREVNRAGVFACCCSSGFATEHRRAEIRLCVGQPQRQRVGYRRVFSPESVRDRGGASRPCRGARGTGVGLSLLPSASFLSRLADISPLDCSRTPTYCPHPYTCVPSPYAPPVRIVYLSAHCPARRLRAGSLAPSLLPVSFSLSSFFSVRLRFARIHFFPLKIPLGKTYMGRKLCIGLSANNI